MLDIGGFVTDEALPSFEKVALFFLARQGKPNDEKRSLVIVNAGDLANEIPVAAIFGDPYRITIYAVHPIDPVRFGIAFGGGNFGVVEIHV